VCARQGTSSHVTDDSTGKCTMADSERNTRDNIDGSPIMPAMVLMWAGLLAAAAGSLVGASGGWLAVVLLSVGLATTWAARAGVVGVRTTLGARIGRATDELDALIDGPAASPEPVWGSGWPALDRNLRQLESTPTRVGAALDQAAANAEALLEVLASLDEPVLVLDEAGVVRIANGAATALIGSRAQAIGGTGLVGSALEDVFPQRELGRIVRDARRSENGRSEGRTRFAIDATLREHAAAAMLIGSDRVVLVLRDVTELSRAVQLKTDFVANASHELRTPLASIRAAAETLEGLGGDDAAMIDRLASLIGQNVARLEEMVRDLLDRALAMVRDEQADRVKEKATAAANDRLVALVLGDDAIPKPTASGPIATEDSGEARARLNQRIREQLDAGELDDREVELTVNKRPTTSVMFANMGLDQMDPDMSNMFEKLIPEQSQRRKCTVADARAILTEQETDKLLDTEKVTAEAIERTEQAGIIFLDEIDKIASGSGEGGRGGGSPDVSRQGVQRDLLPIVEGSAVNTRHGLVHTDHILFIAAGAFHVAAMSDLMPELQGRFPIRVELQPLTKEDFERILTEPGNALTKQQQALLAVEGLDVTFTDDGVAAIAELAAEANARLENIGARRLMTIVERVFEEINFDAPDRAAEGQTAVTIDAPFVRERVDALLQDEDLSKFVL
ncbi:MAG: ATP-dependent protease ATPase subunit HslU, partial [Planctomycetota bacterium]